jgi:hypothetical protein
MAPQVAGEGGAQAGSVVPRFIEVSARLMKWPTEFFLTFEL